MIKYFLVTAKCGHVRKSKYIPVIFAVKAENGKDAAAIVCKIPRVKHDHADAILNVSEVMVDEYDKQRIANENDPFLKVTNKKEHKTVQILFEHRILPEVSTISKKRSEVSAHLVYCKKERIRHPRKWARMNPAA